MQLVAVCTLMAVAAAAAAAPRAVAAEDLFCDCRLWRHRDRTYALHCARDQAGASRVSCQKGVVPEIPRGYQYVPGYAFIKLYRTHKVWLAAKETCEGEGAQLAVPKDRHAFDGLNQIFPKEKGIWYAFLGINDRATEGVFVGMDGLPAPYLPWKPNEPNNRIDGNEDCVELRNDGLLNDGACDQASPFFCERLLSVTVPNTYTWLEEAGRFYKVYKEKRVHAEAAKACSTENATLAVTDTWRRGEALLRLFEPNFEVYLIGFTDEAVEGDFVTETGRHLKDMEFQVWGPNEPGHNDAKNCLGLVGRGFYKDVPCDSELPFICEIAPI